MASPATSIDVRDLVRLLNATATTVGPGHVPAEEVLGRALDLLCDFIGWPLAHVYLLDRRSARLRPTSIWHALRLGARGSGSAL